MGWVHHSPVVDGGYVAMWHRGMVVDPVVGSDEELHCCRTVLGNVEQPLSAAVSPGYGDRPGKRDAHACHWVGRMGNWGKRKRMPDIPAGLLRLRSALISSGSVKFEVCRRWYATSHNVCRGRMEHQVNDQDLVHSLTLPHISTGGTP